jgi:hypothetical protein
MFSHGSSLDAFLMFASCPVVCAGVGKKFNFMVRAATT